MSDKKGMTFASGLRSVLRQDPDIIMVGEIRDLETATMAIQSSLTGHLVFSTLHTNDAASAVARLLDLGIEPYLVSSSSRGRAGTRGAACSAASARLWQAHQPSPIDLRWLGVAAALGMRGGAGCDICRQTGYRGRLGAFELLKIDEPIRRLIQSRCHHASEKLATQSDCIWHAHALAMTVSRKFSKA